jgi:hypothetical protein
VLILPAVLLIGAGFWLALGAKMRRGHAPHDRREAVLQHKS